MIDVGFLHQQGVEPKLIAALGAKSERRRIEAYLRCCRRSRSNSSGLFLLGFYMNKLMNVDSSATMSSREIAELTGKQHQHVKRDIENMLCELGEDASKYGHIYVDSMNRSRPEYLLDRERVECLLTGYSATLRMKVIKRLRELESESAPLIPRTFAEALRLAADQAEKLALAAPKVEFVDKFVDRGVLMTATQIGQHIGMSAIILNRHLERLNVYSSNVKRAKVFRQWFIDKGYGTMKQTDTGYSQPLFTTSGQYWVSSQVK